MFLLILAACTPLLPMTYEQECDVLDYIEDYLSHMEKTERQVWLQEIVQDFEKREKYRASQGVL